MIVERDQQSFGLINVCGARDSTHRLDRTDDLLNTMTCHTITVARRSRITDTAANSINVRGALGRVKNHLQMHAAIARQLHAREQRHCTPCCGILLFQCRQFQLQPVDPAASVVVGYGNALDALIQIVLQPLARRDVFVTLVIQRRGSMVVKVEFPPSRARIIHCATPNVFCVTSTPIRMSALC